MARCAACGGVAESAYCAECVQSKQAAYDRADRAGDRAAMANAEMGE